MPICRSPIPAAIDFDLPARASRLFATSFLRFCVIGALGFAVDAGLLLGLMRWASADALAARLLSFACAVLVTFECNRRWTFRSASARPYLADLAAYLGVQGLGFACNFVIYAACYVALRPAPAAPLLALALASATALGVNYAGARFVVFRPGRDGSRAARRNGQAP